MLRALVAIALFIGLAAAGGGCARHIDILDMGASLASSGPTMARLTVDLTASTEGAHPESRVKLHLGNRVIFDGRATTMEPIEIVDLDPGRYRLEIVRLPDEPTRSLSHEFDLAEGRHLHLSYDDARWEREFWDGVGEGALVSAKVVGILALVGGAIALDVAIFGGACCCGAIPDYTPLTVLAFALLLN